MAEKTLMMVAVLFARADSVYKRLPGCDVWDIDRDARNWPGGAPVVAHPPCRAWGRLRGLAKPRPDEKDLGRWAVAQVRAWGGGVLEHPAHSTLWRDQQMPAPGTGCDRRGGWTLPVNQSWWGHRAEKATWLYLVGVPRGRLPPMPFRLGPAEAVVCTSKRQRRSGAAPKVISKAEREHTPPELAAWLCEVARRAER